MKYLLRALTIILISTAANASNNIPSVEKSADLPIDSLKAVQVNGEVFFMSKNGRYVFQGQLTDSWSKKTLDTIDEIEYSTKHIDVERFGLPIKDMNVITFGNGPETVYSFVDPQCGYCKSFVKEAKEKLEEYTFKLIVVPALGEKSNKLSKSLYCASDKSKSLEAFMADDLSNLQQKDACDSKYYDLTLTFAQLVGVNAVPFMIAPDGRYKAGAGKDVWKWISNEE